MAIPRVDREKILDAMKEFDSVLVQTDEWRGWEEKGSQVWALLNDGRRYPPKKVVAMATGISVNDFSGGPETNAYLNERGFEVVRLRQASLDSIFKSILERYDTARRTTPFKGNHEIKELFNEARRVLSESREVRTHPNIRVVASYGNYEASTIAVKHYEIGVIPGEPELLSDLENLLKAYDLLRLFAPCSFPRARPSPFSVTRHVERCIRGR